MKRTLTVLILAVGFMKVFPQETDTVKTVSHPEKRKTGWNVGALPSVLFNSDLGFQYGILANIFNYGDGSRYPDYKYSFYTEWSRTTKGGGINQLFFDSKYLLPWDLRVTSDFSYLTQQALDFYGFNGYEAQYNPDWETPDDTAYSSKMFYKLERKLLRLDVGFQKPLKNKHFRALLGFAYFDINMNNVDIEALNKGRDTNNLLPVVDGLYQKYVDWGLITEAEKDGGNLGVLKTGLVYDTRDNEPNPMKGMWSEVILATSPGFLGNTTGFSKLVLIHRQYFTLVKDRLSLACRLGYQGTLTGKTPFFMQSYMFNSFPKTTTVDGLGGGKSLRGIRMNRIVGDAIAYGNLEFRWKALKGYFWNQNFYIALSGFADFGRVVKKHEVDLSQIPDTERSFYISTDQETFHPSLGGGVHIAMNQNFVIAIDYGKALDKRDGKDGMYIGLNFLF